MQSAIDIHSVNDAQLQENLHMNTNERLRNAVITHIWILEDCETRKHKVLIVDILIINPKEMQFAA